MERESFLDLDLNKQVDYFNEHLKNGISISKIARELGISKSITSKFKNHGYVLKDNVYIKADKEQNNTEQEAKNKNDYISNKEVYKVEESEPKEVNSTKAKIGRPKKQTDREKRTIIMDSKLWKLLRIYSLKNDTTASDIIEGLVFKFLNDSVKDKDN